eukprot:733433-Hanusia_phi.AAC.1
MSRASRRGSLSRVVQVPKFRRPATAAPAGPPRAGLSDTVHGMPIRLVRGAGPLQLNHPAGRRVRRPCHQ